MIITQLQVTNQALLLSINIENDPNIEYHFISQLIKLDYE